MAMTKGTMIDEALGVLVDLAQTRQAGVVVITGHGAEHADHQREVPEQDDNGLPGGRQVGVGGIVDRGEQAGQSDDAVQRRTGPRPGRSAMGRPRRWRRVARRRQPENALDDGGVLGRAMEGLAQAERADHQRDRPRPVLGATRLRRGTGVVPRLAAIVWASRVDGLAAGGVIGRIQAEPPGLPADLPLHGLGHDLQLVGEGVADGGRGMANPSSHSKTLSRSGSLLCSRHRSSATSCRSVPGG